MPEIAYKESPYILLWWKYTFLVSIYGTFKYQTVRNPFFMETAL